MPAKSGCLRRVAILLAFFWAFNRFVLSTDEFVADPVQREYLFYLLIAATAWGIATLFADRARPVSRQPFRRPQHEYREHAVDRQPPGPPSGAD